MRQVKDESQRTGQHTGNGQVIIGWRVESSEGHWLVAGGSWVVRKQTDRQIRKGEKITKERTHRRTQKKKDREGD